ncbi:L-aminopeptidase/D-esterase-like protein [Murinocardiopsis flavida]|uniref:L-aminopeptidase/D-esterase-like protein n=1 Tax=Murinocardiopsis flavida TaxID=645275 RepID=A0A2P8DSW0_9ACTN|nr:P1 family peptidase [Murinocardiopsis flavida]PSL00303.1 L-aminopeptidase/D-esterase-like protein [Murinocardiopsis flavida]
MSSTDVPGVERPAPEPRPVRPSAFAPGARGNADGPLVPQASKGRESVPFDIPGVLVGTAEYGEGPTGCTVVHVPAGARTAADVRGGAVGMVGGFDRNHAVCFAGGSVYGLAAAAGVSAELLRRGDNRTHWADLKLVSGAVIYDFSARDTAVVPDAELGRAALDNARAGEFPVGRCGAGIGASVGKLAIDTPRAEFAGQGAAYASFDTVNGPAKVLVGTVVNAVGVIVNRDGAVVRGNRHGDGVRRHPAEDIRAGIGGGPAVPVSGNTTLTVLVTNVRLPDASLQQFARQVHSSMHRAIQPFHTETDGDVLFALTTDEIELAGATPTGFGALASEVAWDAVLSSAV